MSASRLTNHPIIRLSQRALRADDLEVLDAVGTEVEGGTILLRKNAQAFEREAKQLIDRIWRLVGRRCVSNGDVVITAYHASRGKQLRLLRRD